MTIVAGFRVVDGILMCSDSQYSGGAKMYQQKLFPMTITGDSYVFALAGHEHNGKMAIDECQEALSELAPERRTLKHVKRALKSAVKPVCDEYVLSRPQSEQDGYAFELLIGCWIPRGGGHQLFTVGRNGAVVLDDHYDCLGTGSYLGHYFIKPSYGAASLDMESAKLLAAQVLRVAKSYDQNCGGPSNFVVIDKDGKAYPVGFNFLYAESFLSMYEARTRNLMFAMTGDIPKAEYDEHLSGFLEQLDQLRKGWRSVVRQLPFE